MPSIAAHLRRAAIMVASLAVAAVVIWFLVAYSLFHSPSLGSPQKADAVIVLAGAGEERLPVARNLMDRQMAPVLSPSTTDTPGNAMIDDLCDHPLSADNELRCFTPNQFNTRSEARGIGRLIDEQDWDSVIVVTSVYHTTRAHLLIDQCTEARVQMVASEPDFGPLEWMHRFVVESGGVIQGFWHPACP